MWIQIVDKEKLRKAIEESGYRKKFICDRVGMKLSSLCTFLRDGYGLSEQKIKAIAFFLDVDFKDLLITPEVDGMDLGSEGRSIIKDYLVSKIED